MTIRFTSSGDSVQCRILLPTGREAASVLLDGKPVEAVTEQVENSSYLVLTSTGRGVREIRIALNG